MPLFRWGVSLALLAAEHHGVEPPSRSLTTLESLLEARSNWTLWVARS